ncbi:carboxypeptidase-like regulatory domain-containing protein [Pedobacter frigiditerrae]|uniref:Carboxypeptidase-like regulatory domain-containing protein n=1 Tax=Pedobacter frigiditerrae TaxID=2530452 RepID=A0A4R0MYS1_9SPHI|nr:carboxypeptidase-like regulatory domain-containing protein [Pedobacter frigiditerrae]TCC92073.1 carboxypeptidase-like regulatory domain-containing protein [Pedobacter frigiditerrae]
MENVEKNYPLCILLQTLMPNLKITIPKPCAENWENMKPLEQGRFCDSCEKQVLDFTKFSTNELIDYFKYPKGNVCGRMTKVQLENSIPLQNQSSRFKNLSYKIFVASCLTLLTSTKGYSKEIFRNQNIYQDDVKSRKSDNSAKKTDTLITISGVVKDSSDGLPIPGASILVKDGQSLTTTDVNGRFKIQIKSGSNQKLILVSKYLGYETMETEIDLASAQNFEIKIKITPSVLGEITTIMAGGIVVKRSLTNKIGYFFKKVFTGRY